MRRCRFVQVDAGREDADHVLSAHTPFRVWIFLIYKLLCKFCLPPLK